VKNRAKEILIYAGFAVATTLTVGILIWILIYLFIKGIGHIDLVELWPAIVTTLYLVGLSLVLAVPVGVGTAIYLNEYAKKGRLVRVIRFANQSLSALPSILFGLFGMMFFVLQLKLRYSLLAGALTVAIMILPTVVKATEEALKTVPNSYREGSLALGVTKVGTIYKVVLPSAIPGILAGVVLSVGRIIGETAAIFLTAGMVFRIPTSIMQSGRTLSVHLYILAKEGISIEAAYGVAIVLLLVVLFLNLLTYAIGNLLRKNKL
jgi:phosphate transport system permease protein